MQIPALYAHRLGRAYGPDSSATALAASLAAGVDGLETDVCVTADDELVLLHDPLLTLGTTLGGWAHRRSATEILRARILDRNGEPTAERPLTLDELLAATPSDLPIQVEVKAHADPELARRTAQILCERYRTGPERRRLELISFHSAACATAAAYGLRSRLVVWAEYAPEALAAWAVSRGVTGVSVEHFLLAPKLVAVLPPRRLERQHRHRERRRAARSGHGAGAPGRGLHGSSGRAPRRGPEAGGGTVNLSTPRRGTRAGDA